MAKKADDEKLGGRMLLSLGDALETDLRGVAKANDTTAQELLRRAARALVRCNQEHGEVPMDMELVQRQVGLRRGDYELNEPPAKEPGGLRTNLKERLARMSKPPDDPSRAARK